MIELTITESNLLTSCESVIEHGLQTFYEVGRALSTIREEKLYRQTHSTFEDYLEKRWNMSRAYASRLIAAADTVENLLPMGNILPSSERQVRPLTSLPSETQPLAWQRTVETAPGGKVTAAHVEAVARQFKEPEAEYSYIPEQPQPMKLLASSVNDAWRTPSKYIEAARQVMGSIYLDPASSQEANKTIKATYFFTREDNGLNQLWEGKVWCNPPYGKTNGKSNQGLFAHKLLKSYQDGLVNEGIILLNLYFGYEWFAPLRELPMCFVDHRIAFINPDTDEAGDEAKASSVFIYVGNKPNRFFYIFKEFGPCAQPTYDW